MTETVDVLHGANPPFWSIPPLSGHGEAASLRSREIRRQGVAMGTDRALGLMNEMLWNALVIAGPVMGVTLAVGLLISVLQVATQIQEITLSYVPKTLAAAVTMIALGPWMIMRLTDFARSLYLLIPTLSQ